MKNVTNIGSSKRLTISRVTSEFEQPSVERAYRRWIWPEISNTFRPILIIVILAVFITFYVDTVYVEYGPALFGLLALRLLTVVIFVRAYLVLGDRRKIERLPGMLIEAVSGILLTMPAIIATRPVHFMFPIVSHIAIEFIIYMFVPFSILPTTFILSLSSLLAVVITAVRGDLPLVQIISIAVPYLIANALGTIASYRYNRTRRLEFAQDLAERQLARQLLAAKLHAEQANEAKSNFMAFMSHEIRTPLTSMLGFAQLLGDGPLTPVQQNQLEIIMRAGKTLTRILNDMLDIARVEAGRTPIEAAPFELISTITELADLTRPKARAHNMDVSVSVSGAFDHVWVLGDAARLQQILSNLIENGIKYAGIGCVSIEVQTELPQPNQNVVPIKIIVSDEGAGIPDHLHATIFDPFIQGRASGVETGVGLGLYICRQLMQAMGGVLILLERSKGAQFQLSFNLPLTKASKPESDPVAKPYARPLHILVVDDSEFNRLLLTAALERDGHKVVTADDGRAGVEAVMARRFDVILMDMRMPIMDGVEAVRMIRSSPGPNTDGLVIFALTANVMLEDVEEYRAVGVDEVIPKPIDLRHLAKALSEIAPLPAD